MEVILYEQDDGRCPFNDWLFKLRDKMAQARIIRRLHNIEAGNLGDFASVGEGVLELRVHIGAGYRVYCGRSGTDWVILLCGGDKSSQAKDIQRAREFWADWKRGRNETT
jgi:putative addiction module killer protein